MKKTCLMICVALALSACTPRVAEDNITIPESTPVPTPEPRAEELIGRYETTMIDMTQARIDNITLAASKINGTVISSGDEFSFNGIVGVRSEQNGYQKAPIIVEDRKEEEVGGGICQLSTTIYNAALAAGLDVTEHHTHTIEVPYIEKGKDATVDYGVMDLRIRNNRQHSVRYVVSVAGDKVLAEIWG